MKGVVLEISVGVFGATARKLRSQNKMHSKPFPHFSTEAIHAGQPPEPRTGAVVVPLSLATTFYQESPGSMQTVWSNPFIFKQIKMN